LKLILQAVDISEQAVEIAKSGMYSPAVSRLTGTDVFDAMTPAEIEELFDRNGNILTVKSWIKEGIEWHVGDVGDSKILSIIGSHDIVVANNFLCHMNASAAGSCLRNIAQLVTHDGYLFVSGIDLDIRTKVAEDLGWRPIEELLEEIHYGDPRMVASWPFNYSSLEPLNKKRIDWKLRYAAAFQLVSLDERSRNSELNPCSGFAETYVSGN